MNEEASMNDEEARLRKRILASTERRKADRAAKS